MESVKNSIKVIAVIIGTFVGAGFASGKEIYIFFTQYGEAGLIGAVISSLLTGIIIYETLSMVKKCNIENNNQFVEIITNNKKSAIIKNVINIFLLISFFIMCAGFSTFFKQEMGIPIIITGIILGIIMYFVFMKNVNGIIQLNTILVPIMIIIILYIGTKSICEVNITTRINVIGDNIWKAIINSILYTSYNSIILIPIIISVSKCVKDRKNSLIVTIFTAIIIVMMIAVMHEILMNSGDIKYVDMPILKILNSYDKIIYACVVVAAIFTSAVSAGYGLIDNIKEKNKYKLAALVICILQIPISYIGFGKLVEGLYPVFGVIGIAQIVLIIWKEYKLKYCKKM